MFLIPLKIRNKQPIALTEKEEKTMTQTRREFIKKAAALSAASYVSMSLPIDAINLARADEGIIWHRGSCRLCGVGCRVELGVKDGVPMGLRGVSESRTNFGYVCMKGMHFWKCMRHPDRLTKPLYREKKTDKFQEISWDKALILPPTSLPRHIRPGAEMLSPIMAPASH